MKFRSTAPLVLTMVKRLTCCMAVTCFLLVGVRAYAGDVVTVRVADFPPNYIEDDAGNWKGLSVELADAIISAAGYVPEFVELPWSRAIKSLENGDLAYMTNLSKTDERSRFLDWIGPIRVDRMGLFVHGSQTSLPITSLDDFLTVCTGQKMQFGIQQDVVYSAALTKRLNDDEKFRECFRTVAKVDSNLNMVANRRIIGFLESIVSIKYRIATDPEFADLAAHPFVLEADTSAEIYHGLSKQGVSEEMKARLQKGYEKCVEDGTVQRILEKWSAQ